MLDAITNWLLSLVGVLDYWGIFFLMAVESSFIPFPSELVIPPAAFLAAKGEMSLVMVIICGTAGSLIGAYVNYFLALYLGKPLVYTAVKSKWAKFFLLNERKLHKAEQYFLKYGGISTFIGRLIPAVRQLISIPAGFVRMNLLTFSLFTVLGAGIWVTVLALLGYWFGANGDLASYYYVKMGLVAVGVFLIAIFAWAIRKKRK